MTLDTSNQFAVGAAGDRIQIAFVALLYDRNGMLGKDEALVHAGWLLCLADPDSAAHVALTGTPFGEIVRAILET